MYQEECLIARGLRVFLKESGDTKDRKLSAATMQFGFYRAIKLNFCVLILYFSIGVNICDFVTHSNDHAVTISGSMLIHERILKAPFAHEYEGSSLYIF